MISIIRAVIASVSDVFGSTRVFSATGRVGETFVNRELWQHYGFASSPLAGACGLAVAHGNQVFLIADDDTRYRLELLPGEVALYDSLGSAVRLGADGFVTVGAASGVSITAPLSISLSAGASIALAAANITVTGDLSVTGNILATGTVHGSNI